MKWARGPGQRRDREGPLNASWNCVAFHMPSFQFCRSTGQKRQTWYDLAAYISKKIGNDHVRRFVCSLICSSRKFHHKKSTFLLPWHDTTNFFFIDSLTIFTAQIVHPRMYWGKICLHSFADQKVAKTFGKDVLNEISRKGNLNRTTWLMFCDGSFAIDTRIDFSVIYWTTALYLI